MFNRKVVLVLDKCQLLVIFKDGEKRFIDDVELYGHNSGSDVFWFEKNDKRCFFPISQVKYFGASCNYEVE